MIGVFALWFFNFSGTVVRLVAVPVILITLALLVRSTAASQVGVWAGQSAFPQYDMRPDKETPLWNVHSPVIYWWTATELDAERAYMICYKGQVRPRRKNFAPAYFAFRAVKAQER